MPKIRYKEKQEKNLIKIKNFTKITPVSSVKPSRLNKLPIWFN